MTTIDTTAASVGLIYLEGGPCVNDLVCHKNPGKEWSAHNNKLPYNDVIGSHRDPFRALKKKQEKNRMIMQVIRICKEKHNMRFVRNEDAPLCTGRWYILRDQEVQGKVRTILRPRPRKKQQMGNNQTTPTRVYHAALSTALNRVKRVQKYLYDHPEEAPAVWDANEDVRDSTDNDVIPGRGAGAYDHFGNRVMIELAKEYKEMYPGLEKPLKTRLSASICHAIRHELGGRFLEKEGGTWKVQSFGSARQKVAQRLRDEKDDEATGGGTVPEGAAASADLAASTTPRARKKTRRHKKKSRCSPTSVVDPILSTDAALSNNTSPKRSTPLPQGSLSFEPNNASPPIMKRASTLACERQVTGKYSFGTCRENRKEDSRKENEAVALSSHLPWSSPQVSKRKAQGSISSSMDSSMDSGSVDTSSSWLERILAERQPSSFNTTTGESPSALSNKASEHNQSSLSVSRDGVTTENVSLSEVKTHHFMADSLRKGERDENEHDTELSLVDELMDSMGGNDWLQSQGRNGLSPSCSRHPEIQLREITLTGWRTLLSSCPHCVEEIQQQVSLRASNMIAFPDLDTIPGDRPNLLEVPSQNAMKTTIVHPPMCTTDSDESEMEDQASRELQPRQENDYAVKLDERLWDKFPVVEELKRDHFASEATTSSATSSNELESELGLLRSTQDAGTAHKILSRVRDYTCHDAHHGTEIVAMGGIACVIRAMQRHSGECDVQSTACRVLRNLVRDNPDHRDSVAAAGGIECVINCMKNHSKSVRMQEAGCEVLCYLALDHADNRVSIADAGGVECVMYAIIFALENPFMGTGLREAGCRALVNLAFENVENQAIIAQLANEIHDTGRTALMDASLKGCDSVVRVFVESGADVDRVSHTGRTALMFACQFRQESTVQILKDASSPGRRHGHPETSETQEEILADIIVDFGTTHLMPDEFDRSWSLDGAGRDTSASVCSKRSGSGASLSTLFGESICSR